MKTKAGRATASKPAGLTIHIILSVRWEEQIAASIKQKANTISSPTRELEGRGAPFALSGKTICPKPTRAAKLKGREKPSSNENTSAPQGKYT